MKLKLLKKLILSVLLVASPGCSFASLIVNGGFEDAPDPDSGNYPKPKDFGGTVYYANSVPVGPLKGWTFGYDGTLDNTYGTAEVEWYSDAFKKSWNAAPASGQFAVQLNSDAFRGRIYAQPSLTQNLTVGQTYTLTFDLAPEAGVLTPSAVSAVVTIDGIEHAFSVPASSSPTSTWTHESMSFVATSQTPSIRFYDGTYRPDVNSNFGNNINLDNVALVPEPSPMWAVAFLGLAVVIWHVRSPERSPC